MSQRSQRLRALVTERLTAAAEEIFVLVERTIAEYEEELSRCKEENQLQEENQRRQQVLEENQRRQQVLEENQRRQQVLEENQRRQQVLEENQRRQQLLEENQRRQQVLEENQRRQQVLEENQRRQQLLQKNQQLLEEKLKPCGAGDTVAQTEEEEFGPSLKQEDEEFHLKEPCAQWDKPRIQDFPPNLLHSKPNLEPQEYLRPGESSPSDADLSDDEPPMDEADLQDFYRQNEPENLENVGDGASAGSSNVKAKPGRPPKQCAICGKVYGDLKRHMVVHTGEKPYSCSLCEKRFTRKGSLQCHMAVHRGDTPYRCPVCGKMFSQKGHLQTHAVMHSGEKPFSCVVCSAKFASRALLSRHKRVHTGVKPFCCPFCDRGFTRNEHLRRHVQTHTGPLNT